MASVAVDSRRSELVGRRARLARAISAVGAMPDLQRLIDDVDETLKRYDEGNYGLCEVCGEPIADAQLAANPMWRYCLCHLDHDELSDLDRDLTLAGRIQSGLLPQEDLLHAGWWAHYRYLPAGRVSGDHVDLAISAADGSLFFVIGDVSGKGVAASLLMAHLSALLRSFVDVGLSADRLLERANRLFSASTIPGHYATLVCGRASADGDVEIANAGHLPTLLVRNERVEEVASNGRPIGLFDDGDYGSCTVRLSPGESLFFCTDGLTETSAPTGEEYGLDRLTERLTAGAGTEPRAMAASILDDVHRFSDHSVPGDDTTVLVIQRIG